MGITPSSQLNRTLHNLVDEIFPIDKEINLDDINLSCDSYNQVLDKFSIKESNISINQNDNNSIMDIII